MSSYLYILSVSLLIVVVPHSLITNGGGKDAYEYGDAAEQVIKLVCCNATHHRVWTRNENLPPILYAFTFASLNHCIQSE
jgi:hypothetical protein